MKRALIGLLLASIVAGCGRVSDETSAVQAPLAKVIEAKPAADPVEGERIATRIGCNGCHTKSGAGEVFQDIPKVGRFVAPNLTERRSLYDDAALVHLLREGKTHDGHRPLGMPILMFQHLSDRELRDITAWLRALPAVANPDLPAPWLSDTVKKQLATDTFPYDDDRPDPGNVPPIERPVETVALGKHLAMTSCPECHGKDLNGFGPDDPAPSLIVAKAYTPEGFMRLMRTGKTMNGKDTKTMMSGVARYRFASMTDEEISALKAFLDSR